MKPFLKGNTFCKEFLARLPAQFSDNQGHPFVIGKYFLGTSPGFWGIENERKDLLGIWAMPARPAGADRRPGARRDPQTHRMGSQTIRSKYFLQFQPTPRSVDLNIKTNMFHRHFGTRSATGIQCRKAFVPLLCLNRGN